MISLEELQLKLDRIAARRGGKLPELKTKTLEEWQTLLPEVYDFVHAHLVDEFREQCVLAIGRWHKRHAEELARRFAIGPLFRSDRRITRRVMLAGDIRQLYEEGHGIRDIATDLQLNRQTVRNEIAEYERERRKRGLPWRPIKN